MATKSKTPAKGTAATKSKVATKPAAKAAPKSAAKKAVAHKPAAKKLPAKKSPPPKAVKGKAPVPAKPDKAAKPAKAAAPAKAAPPVKSGAAKAGAKSGKGAGAPVTNAVAGAGDLPTLPPPKPTPRIAQVVSQKDLASAHEYLLIRSASRSEEPVVVDGKPLLTEEQLLSMPDSDYMNADQLAFFRYQLQQIERELLSNADETTEHLRETVIVPDPADRATIEEEHALELRTRDRERKLLKKVQASLQQIESGEYGFCEETGDPIGIPRLLARPTATLSLEAQQRREIKQKLFGD